MRIPISSKLVGPSSFALAFRPGQLTAQKVNLPADLPVTSALKQPPVFPMASRAAAFDFLVSVVGYRLQCPPALPADDHLKVLVLALCFMASHPERSVLRSAPELDCVLLHSLQCYGGTRTEGPKQVCARV